MKKQLMMCIGFLVILSGCANVPQISSLSQFIPATSTPVGQLGDGTGYQPVFNIPIPAGTCNKQAFIDGFKDGYLSGWNSPIHEKINDGHVSKQKLLAYKSKLIGSTNYQTHATNYPLFGSYGYQDNCGHGSYGIGNAQGTLLATKNWNAMILQGI